MSSSRSMSDKILILDIDECCCKSFTDPADGDKKTREMMSLPENVSFRQKYFSVNMMLKDEDGSNYPCNFWGTKRPYLDKFLHFAGQYFDKIIIWSAGSKEYVKKMVECLFRDHRAPDMILSRKHVVYIEDENIEDPDDRDYKKPIDVINKIRPNFIDPKKVFCIDDRIGNFRDNPNNGILIPKFEPPKSDSFSSKDDSFVKIQRWLMSDEVMKCKDVTLLDKSRIFEQSNKNQNIIMNQHRFVSTPFSFF